MRAAHRSAAVSHRIKRGMRWTPSGWARSVLLAAALAAACAAGARAPAAWVADEAPNYRRAENGLATADAITLPAIPKLAAAGFKTIIDLRAPSEPGVAEEAAAVEGVGLRYVNVPITAATLSGDRVRAVAAVLDRPANRPVLMHCSSGNRVGAVMELYREKIHGVDHEAARTEARAMGLQLPQVIEAVERVRREMESAH